MGTVADVIVMCCATLVLGYIIGRVVSIHDQEDMYKKAYREGHNEGYEEGLQHGYKDGQI
jgi:hypothetical protein